jgi:hypothetical protein
VLGEQLLVEVVGDQEALEV